MEHEDATFPFGGGRGAIRLVGVLGAAALLAVVAAHRHPRGTLEPWRPAPAALPAAHLTGSLSSSDAERVGGPEARRPTTSPGPTGEPVR